MPIVADRLRAKLPCTDECNLRWRERPGGTVEFRHGKKSIVIQSEEKPFSNPGVPRAGWLSEAIDWIIAQHPEGDW